MLFKIPDFIRVWNNSGPPYSLEKNSSNILKRSMAILSQIPKVDWVDRSNETIPEDELIGRIEQAFKKNRDINHLGFGEVETADLDEVRICIFSSILSGQENTATLT